MNVDDIFVYLYVFIMLNQIGFKRIVFTLHKCVERDIPTVNIVGLMT